MGFAYRGVWVMGYCRPMGYGMQFPANQVSGQLKLWDIRGYGLWGVWVMRGSTVVVYTSSFSLLFVFFIAFHFAETTIFWEQVTWLVQLVAFRGFTACSRLHKSKKVKLRNTDTMICQIKARTPNAPINTFEGWRLGFRRWTPLAQAWGTVKWEHGLSRLETC